jgi:hypothetical protein
MASVDWEWCWDVYSPSYSVSPTQNPRGPAISPEDALTAPRVTRGAATAEHWNGLWSTFWVNPAWRRWKLSPDCRSREAGGALTYVRFRYVVEPDDEGVGPGQAGESQDDSEK